MSDQKNISTYTLSGKIFIEIEVRFKKRLVNLILFHFFLLESDALDLIPILHYISFNASVHNIMCLL